MNLTELRMLAEDLKNYVTPAGIDWRQDFEGDKKMRAYWAAIGPYQALEILDHIERQNEKIAKLTEALSSLRNAAKIILDHESGSYES